MTTKERATRAKKEPLRDISIFLRETSTRDETKSARSSSEIEAKLREKSIITVWSDAPSDESSLSIFFFRRAAETMKRIARISGNENCALACRIFFSFALPATQDSKRAG